APRKRSPSQGRTATARWITLTLPGSRSSRPRPAPQAEELSPPSPGMLRRRKLRHPWCVHPRKTRSLAPVSLAPAVIPLVHAPDDPGPDPEAHIEPRPETTDGPTADNWSRFRHL